MAVIAHACDWELHRRRGIDFALSDPQEPTPKTSRRASPRWPPRDAAVDALEGNGDPTLRITRGRESARRLVSHRVFIVERYGGIVRELPLPRELDVGGFPLEEWPSH